MLANLLDFPPIQTAATKSIKTEHVTPQNAARGLGAVDLLELIEAKKGEPPHGVPADVAALFEKIALELVNEGFRRFSADAVLHEVRFRNRVKWAAGEFKCNNNWTADLARWFLARHPELRGFFETRQTRSEAA